jgi:hypothetical protein
MRITKWLFWALCCPIGVFAQEISIDGTILKKVKIPNHQLSRPSQMGSDETQTIGLLNMHLSAQMQQKFIHQAERQSKDSFSEMNATSSVDLGMDTVPVLNQGIHGSCVTFSVTAAIDAILKKGDYVSQLCSLQLGRHLQSYGYVSSGWEGGLGAVVLSQMETFGFMTKEMQRQVGCGHLFEYPVVQNDIGEEMTPIEFHQMSESLVQNRIAWSNLVDIFQVIHDDLDGSKILEMVKNSLNHGDRLVFGVLLADYDKGLVGAVGTHKVFNDTWTLTPEIVNDIQQHPQFAGHEMLIIGYDDEAIAKDDHGREYKGLLKLRNSWGERIGDQGDFYMTYDYFRAFVMELQRIRQIRPNK